MKLAKKITVDLTNNTLAIDGEQFEYYIQPGVEIMGLADPNGVPTVNISIFAETVEVIPAGEKA